MGSAWPENSLAAFERALEIGVDAIEADLQVTKDGRLIARHNDLIQRDGQWSFVRELSLEELQQIDLGNGERIPSLEQVFERFHGRCPIVLDVKAFGMAEPLASFLLKRRAQRDVHVTSFLHVEIAEIGRLAPELDRSITFAAMPIRFEGLLQDAGTKAVVLYRGYLNEAIVRHLRDLGVGVQVYPVNLVGEAQAFASWGVRGIFTDDPAALQSLRGQTSA